MEESPNKALIRRWIAFANSGFQGDFMQFIAANFVGHVGPVNMGFAELEQAERDLCAAFPDINHSIDDLIAEGDRVVLRTTAHATHRGEFQGVPRTDRHVEFTGLVVYRIENGRIAECWGEIDFLRLMRQLRDVRPS
jgi:steroid delta-isomerase-like uncharacterized protein